jgi:hypothetical protein
MTVYIDGREMLHISFTNQIQKVVITNVVGETKRDGETVILFSAKTVDHSLRIRVTENDLFELSKTVEAYDEVVLRLNKLKKEVKKFLCTEYIKYEMKKRDSNINYMLLLEVVKKE